MLVRYGVGRPFVCRYGAAIWAAVGPKEYFSRRVADAIEWSLRQEGVQTVMHYLDEFVVLGQARSDECQRAVNVVLRVISTLGLPVAEDKLEGPSTRLSFLGLDIDTVAMKLRIPAEKLRDLQVLIHSYGVVGGRLPSWS